MEIAEIVSKLNRLGPGTVLQKIRFGKTEGVCLWIEKDAIVRVAETLKTDSVSELDWLESLSVAQIDGALVFSYFLRSSKSGDTLVLRASSDLASPDSRVQIPSVSDIWAMAVPMEKENTELFGVDFLNAENAPSKAAPEKLPPNWLGYPLRKTYVFPQEVYGIPHARPALAGRHSRV